MANDYDRLLDSLDARHRLRGRDIIFYVYNDVLTFVSMDPSRDTTWTTAAGMAGRRPTPNPAEGAYFYYDFSRQRAAGYAEAHDLGEFLYRLHFLAPLNEVPIRLGYPFGYVLAGIVSFMFLFAVITGLLLHWDKLFTNFFTFRPWSRWKTVWTDLHTTLGVIGFPFQLLYAVTGMVLIINILLLQPFSHWLYEGDTEQLYTEIGDGDGRPTAYQHRPLEGQVSLNRYLQDLQVRWPECRLNRIYIRNYGDESMRITIDADAEPSRHFAGHGRLVIYPAQDSVAYEKSPYHSAEQPDRIKAFVYRLHFGDFGGYPVKTSFFVLGVMGCLVILSGILIWLVARDKKSVPLHKRRFNHWAANTFVAVCLTLLPVTAFTFIMVKIQPAAGLAFIYRTFFGSWLFLSVVYTVRSNLAITNRDTLLMGGLLGLAVPIVNGWSTGCWFWDTARTGALDLLTVDLLWLCIAAAALTAAYRVRLALPRTRKPD